MSLVLLAATACTGLATVAPRMRWLAPPPADVSARGVLITTAGIVAPILASDDGGYWVRTPCFHTAWVRQGVRIDAADVVLDPGHGGPELGSVGPTGLEEKVPNLAISERVGEHLQRDGRRVVFTRLGDASYVTIRTRVEIVRALQPKVAVSIHHNAVGPPPRKGRPGTEVFHQFASARSRVLSDLIADEVITALSRYDIAWTADEQPASRTFISNETGLDYYGILRYAGNTPTVITESAFISNGAEEALLRTDGFRATEADAIARALRRFLTTVSADGAPASSTGAEPFPSEPPSDAAECVDPRLS
jgi:N-acetylmuramoyl-L-alanine amidase